MTPRVLVTGAAGSIGTTVSHGLARSYRVRGLGRVGGSFATRRCDRRPFAVGD